MALKLTILILIMCVCNVYNLKMEQVLIFSRHNIRQPLVKNLHQFGLHIWTQKGQDFKVGDLTTKGGVLENYLGEYIANWLKKMDLIPKDCPDENSVYIYANTEQRTRETAKAFIKGAFPNCNISSYSIDSDEMDSIFNPIFRNTSQHIKDVIIEEMQNNINKLDIKNSYKEIDEMINLDDSVVCKEKGFCSFENSSDSVLHEIGKPPKLVGPLKYGNSIGDAYLMVYYDGTPMENIANGQLTVEQIHVLSKVVNANKLVSFNSPVLARDVAKPLLNYIHDAFNGRTKVVIMVGHDSNIQSLLGALEFKDFVLPDQVEHIPIGGKIVFQKLYDEITNQRYLKIKYVYPTTMQIRDGVRISEEHPPKWADLELSTCSTDKNGFISWTCFMNLLGSVK